MMPERTSESFEFRGPKPRTIGTVVILVILFILAWGTFVIVPAGNRGDCSLVGKRGEEGHGGRAQFQSPDCREGG